MRISVKTSSGNMIVLEAQSTDTISSVKARVQDQEGLPATHQHYLIFKGKCLEGDRTLSGYDIWQESILHLVPPKSLNQTFESDFESPVKRNAEKASPYLTTE